MGRGLYLGSGWRVRAKGARYFTVVFECHEVTVGGGQEGELVAGTSLVTRMHLVIRVGCSQPVCGDVEASGKYEVLEFTRH